MKFVIVVAATVASSILVLPTVSQGQDHVDARQAQADTSRDAKELKA